MHVRARAGAAHATSPPRRKKRTTILNLTGRELFGVQFYCNSFAIRTAPEWRGRSGKAGRAAFAPGRIAAMFESLVVTLREGVEAALVIAIAVVYLNKSGRAHLT